MATKITIQNGQARAVYDDKWRIIMEAMGVMEINRATDVEFDGESGDWIATELATGNQIGRGTNRAQCIAEEVEYLETNRI